MRGIKGGSEDELQANFFEWCELKSKEMPELELIYAVPNGGKRPKLTAYRMKLTGCKKGVPDVHLPVARGGYIGLYIEFKTERGKLTPEQADWAARLSSQGHKVIVCRSWTDAADAVTEYLNDMDDPKCKNCGHSVFLHPEMEFGECDGFCSGSEECECERFEG